MTAYQKLMSAIITYLKQKKTISLDENVNTDIKQNCIQLDLLRSI